MEKITLSTKRWAEMEFGSARLGDRRRNKRLIKVAKAVAEARSGVLPPAFPRWSDLKSAYRLLAEEDVTHERILTPHLKKTYDACRKDGIYLLVEDTTDLDFTNRTNIKGLGFIGDGRGQGLYVHSTLALHIEGWSEEEEPLVTILGIFGQSWWAREGEPKHGTESRSERLKRPRESHRWASVFEAMEGPPSGVQWVYIADRESDIYEVFSRCQGKSVNFVIRANQARALADEGGSVFDAVKAASCLDSFSLELRSRPGVKARTAKLELRSVSVTLRGPWRPGSRLMSQSLNVVEALEVGAPSGVTPICWVLLTDLPCETFQESRRIVGMYSRRWLTEEYHKALKTGVGIEETQLTTVESITALLGILAVVAVRLLGMKLLSTGHADEKVIPEIIGIEILAILSAFYGKPEHGWTYRNVLRSIARLGGFLARKSDGQPGWITIWRGWQKLMLLLQGFNMARGL